MFVSVSKKHLGWVVVGLTVALASGCMTTVPIATEAMPGNDIRIATQVAMPLWRVPREGAPLDVGCRVREVDGRAVRVYRDTVWISPVTWWRAEAGVRPKCEQLGTSAMAILPDSTMRTTSTPQVDQKRTGILAGSAAATALLLLGGLGLLIAAFMRL